MIRTGIRDAALVAFAAMAGPGNPGPAPKGSRRPMESIPAGPWGAKTSASSVLCLFCQFRQLNCLFSARACASVLLVLPSLCQGLTRQCTVVPIGLGSLRQAIANLTSIRYHASRYPRRPARRHFTSSGNGGCRSYLYNQSHIYIYDSTFRAGIVRIPPTFKSNFW